MEWLRLKEYGMKNAHIKKLMLIFQDFEELFYEENFKLFNDELKNQLEEAMKIDLKARLELYERNRVRIISANDKEYPKKLKEIKDFPVFLYLKGKKLKDYDKIKMDKDKISVDNRRNIAVVGTRRATKFGKTACEKIVNELVNYDVTLISGLADRIDTIALKTALDKEIEVVAVVGTGLDVVYPYENRNLWERISETGTIISEYPLGTQPTRWTFPRRNRIIAGMSDGVLVAESFKKGGALITAELGFSMNREIFAIPGFINYPSFEGCNNLIKSNKAKLVTSADDIAEEFLWDIRKEKSKLQKLTEEEQIVFETIMEEVSFEQILQSVKEKIEKNKLFSIIMSLKIRGLITETNGAKYIRIV
ncbi:DNA-processing protein DprA [Leptotrichia hongkongensis]|uniref:DNA-processing protein DprA n=1 Tax=Leptotrichia hongkongensis TaxID=554406 RepID=UPI0035A8B724